MDQIPFTHTVSTSINGNALIVSVQTRDRYDTERFDNTVYRHFEINLDDGEIINSYRGAIDL